MDVALVQHLPVDEPAGTELEAFLREVVDHPEFSRWLGPKLVAAANQISSVE